jgi:hypothetical protein
MRSAPATLESEGMSQGYKEDVSLEAVRQALSKIIPSSLTPDFLAERAEPGEKAKEVPLQVSSPHPLQLDTPS